MSAKKLKIAYPFWRNCAPNLGIRSRCFKNTKILFYMFEDKLDLDPNYVNLLLKMNNDARTY